MHEKKKIMIEGFQGVTGNEVNETEYQLAGSLELPVARNTFDKLKIQYSQPQVSAVSCTLHGSIGAVSDLTGYTFTLAERISLWSQALQQGADNVKGWSIPRAIDLVRNYWNSQHPDDSLVSFNIPLTDPAIETMFEKGYSIVIGYAGNGTYSRDEKIDGILDGVSFGIPTYGHCVRMSLKDAVTYNIVVDNYFIDGSSSRNVYEVPKANLHALVNNGVFYPTGRVFAYKADYDKVQLTQGVSNWAQISVAKAEKKGLSTGSPQAATTNVDIENDLFTLGIFTSKTGTITRERWLMALDRMKQLD